MTLSGLTIFKYLPGGLKTKEANCKECGFSTCMAFAMKLAKGETTLEQCKHVSDELRELLEAQGSKHQKQLTFGTNDNQIKIGGETVLYRHEKTFLHPTTISIVLRTSENIETNKILLNKVANYSVERVGEKIQSQSISIANNNNDSDKYNKLLSMIVAKNYHKKLAIIGVSKLVEDLKNTYNAVKEFQKPILYLRNASNDQLIHLYNETKSPVCVESTTFDELITRINELESKKVEEIVITIPSETGKNPIENLTIIRRAVILDNNKSLSYPVLALAGDYCLTDDEMEEALWAGNLICKYANIVLLNHFNPAILYALYTLRQNIFTDPQKPLQIEPKLYSFGEVDKKSPVIVTTNFALTYFSVASEIEASNVPCYLLITNSDGMSVLTAWAANKFNGEIIAKAVKEFELEKYINHKELIIPGYVATLKEEIEEELPGWKVHVAPLEAVEIPEYLNNNFVKV